jgi:hypothetical protein
MTTYSTANQQAAVVERHPDFLEAAREERLATVARYATQYQA